MSDVRSMQLWPGGKSIRVSGDAWGPTLTVHDERGIPIRPANADERRAVQVETLAERYAEYELYHCDSSLVSDLMAADSSGELRGDLAGAFDYSEVSNLRPDPSDWTLEQCREWLTDNGHDLPDPNPWGMTEAQVREALAEHGEPGDFDALSAEGAAEELARLIEDETADGLDAWRDAVNDNAEDAEIFEWWRVSKWLAKELDAVGECVLSNGYGEWWGRCTTGQSLIMDGVLQKVAARHIG